MNYGKLLSRAWNSGWDNKFLILLGEGDFDVRPLEDLNFRPYEGHTEQALRQEKGSNLL